MWKKQSSLIHLKRVTALMWGLPEQGACIKTNEGAGASLEKNMEPNSSHVTMQGSIIFCLPHNQRDNRMKMSVPWVSPRVVKSFLRVEVSVKLNVVANLKPICQIFFFKCMWIFITYCYAKIGSWSHFHKSYDLNLSPFDFIDAPTGKSLHATAHATRQHGRLWLRR